MMLLEKQGAEVHSSCGWSKNFFFDMYGHPSLHSVGSQDKFLVESDISQMIAPPLIPTSD